MPALLLCLTAVLPAWSQNVTEPAAPEPASPQNSTEPVAPGSGGNGTETNAEGLEWLTSPTYEYNATGKPDPFLSFLRTRVEAPIKKKPPRNRPLTPLEQVEITQLKLVGVILGEGGNTLALAMVQLPDGKGFVIKKGDRIGMNDGEVISVSESSVEIREEVETIFGDREARVVSLKMQGEKS